MNFSFSILHFWFLAEITGGKRKLPQCSARIPRKQKGFLHLFQVSDNIIKKYIPAKEHERRINRRSDAGRVKARDGRAFVGA